jgi:hypothetical protein
MVRMHCLLLMCQTFIVLSFEPEIRAKPSIDKERQVTADLNRSSNDNYQKMILFFKKQTMIKENKC